MLGIDALIANILVDFICVCCRKICYRQWWVRYWYL